MKFHEFGDPAAPHIMLIHGGGNAWWNYLRQARALEDRYHVILPNLDGHGEECGTEYRSTEDAADKLMAYIEARCGGRLFALGGVSLGGQIVLELLSRKADLAEKAIVDGSICYPQRAMARFCIAAAGLCWGLMFSERSCRLQIASMGKLLPQKMLYPEEIKALYLRDMPKLRKETLFAIYRSYMANYTLKEGIRGTKAKIAFWYGEKEMKCVKNSAKLVQNSVPSCELYEAKGYDHGYLSIYLPDEWLALAEDFFRR